MKLSYDVDVQRTVEEVQRLAGIKPFEMQTPPRVPIAELSKILAEVLGSLAAYLPKSSGDEDE